MLGYFILTNCMACTPNVSEISEIDPSIIPSSPTLIEAVKTENPWLGLFNAGDTTVKVKPDKEVLPEKPSKAPDLSKIQKEAGKFRLVSVGGALSAGFRDGGLYREGQLTAFPNLIAGQMKVPFVQPLFSEAEGNGTGYKTVAGTAEPLVKFNMVTNNLGVIQRSGETAYTDFAEKDKVQLDQIAFPEISRGLQFFKYPEPKRDISYKYIDRAVSTDIMAKYAKPWDWVNDQKVDLFIFEFGMDDLARLISRGGGVLANPFGIYVSPSPEFGLMRSLGKQSKGVILNVPDVLSFPYFTQITNEKISKLGVKLFVQESSSSEHYRPFNPSIDRIIPSVTAEKLFQGDLNDKVNLKDTEVISEEGGDLEATNLSPDDYNRREIEYIAKEINWPIVDLKSLYKRIQAGGYVTDDGVAVNASWPKGGNFFSADGVYPTAFGQAVIANEVIKTLNRHYGLEIPLLQTRFFIGK